MALRLGGRTPQVGRADQTRPEGNKRQAESHRSPIFTASKISLSALSSTAGLSLRAAGARLRAHRGPLVLFLAITLLTFSSLLSNPLQHGVGHPGNDVWNHVWGYWWVRESLLLGQWPEQTNLLSWPTGGSLYFIDMLGAVLSLPVQLILGPVAAYNAMMAFNLMLCGVGAYALCFRLTGNLAASAVAGAAYMTTPHLVSQLYNGVSEALAAGWLPLALLYGRELVRAPTRQNAALAGALWGLTAVANWYYGLFAGLFVLALGGRELVRWARMPRWMREQRLNLVPRVVALGVSAGALALVAIGPIVAFRSSLRADDALVSRDADFVWMSQIMHNMTDVLTLGHPGKFYSPDLRILEQEDLIVVSYLGFAVVVPALAVLTTSFRKQALPWCVAAAAFAILALGPYLYVSGEYVTVAGGWVGLPFLFLREWVPFFSSISHANRFVVGAGLALAVATGWFVVAMAERGWSAGGVAAGLVAARLCETLLLSPVVWPLPYADFAVPAAYAQVREGAVLDLPISRPVLARSRLLAFQLLHRQPVPFGLNEPYPSILRTNHYTAMLITLERYTIDALPFDLPWLDLAAAQEELRLLGLRYIAVQRSGYDEGQFSRVGRFLDHTASPLVDDGEVRLYEILPAQSPRSVD